MGCYKVGLGVLTQKLLESREGLELFYSLHIYLFTNAISAIGYFTSGKGEIFLAYSGVDM